MNLHTAMTIFRQVAERGSFSAAARETGYSPAAISKNVSELEARLGVRLIERSTRRMRLTSAGEGYLLQCQRLLDEIAEAENEARQEAVQPRGLLRISGPMSFGLLHLSPIVSDFLARHPEVRIDLVLNDRRVNLIEEGFDIALRAGGPLEDSSLIARRLSAIPRSLCAAPAYLEAAGTPETPADLTAHNCLIYTLSASPDIWQFSGPDGNRKVKISGRYQVNSSLALKDAALAGVGIGLLPHFIAGPELENGQLIEVLPDWQTETQSLYVVHSARRFVPAKIRAFVDHLVEAFRQST